MTVTIDFNGKHQFGAIEIDDEAVDGFLAIEVIPAHSFTFDAPPEQNLR